MNVIFPGISEACIIISQVNFQPTLLLYHCIYRYDVELSGCFFTNNMIYPIKFRKKSVLCLYNVNFGVIVTVVFVP